MRSPLALPAALALALPLVAAQGPGAPEPNASANYTDVQPQESTNAHPQTEWIFTYLIVFALALFGGIMGTVYWSENVRGKRR